MAQLMTRADGSPLHMDEADYRLNPDGRALGYERLFGSHEDES